LQAILAAFPDRVARARKGGDLLLALGGGARLAEDSAAHGAEWLVALDAEEAPGRGSRVRLASPIDPAWLLDFPALLDERVNLQWNASQGRVERSETLRYGELVLHESRRVASPGPEAAELLLRAALALNPEDLGAAVLEGLRARVASLGRALPEAGFALPEDFTFRELLARLCRTCVSLRELRDQGAAWMAAEVARALGPERQARLDTLAPTHVPLAGRKRAPVHYPPDAPPYVASRMADFFGMRDTPRIAGGRLPLVVHLLAPNQRPVQITSDLAGFWERHWPRIRRELARRYPRHPWPEDPLA
jgi:ATP-dependent helicase HrpB